jgi:uncharacterized repeat protein (TIGR03843 family)
VSEPAAGRADPSSVVTADEALVLAEGSVEVEGRVLPASNITFYGSVRLDGRSVGCVYKPVAGERPLWDFPDGSLAGREVAAYAVSDAVGWNVVPLTVLRDGPAGPGMVQIWREPDPAQSPVDVVAQGRLPAGYLHVLDARDGRDRPVSLVHEDSIPLRRMAIFDAVVNNADRKGGHVLPMRDGHRYGVDHGVSFHVERKLRTVLWGWADARMDDEELAALEHLLGLLSDGSSALHAEVSGLVEGAEVEALARRTASLLRSRRMPVPPRSWPAIPWPAF